MAILKIDSVTAGYEIGDVVRSASLDLTTGMVMGLSGRNGAGKSTFFKAVLGILPSPHGQVFLDGRFVAPRDRWKSLGYLPQEGFLPPNLQVQRLAGFFLHGRSRQEVFFNHPRIKEIRRTKVSALSEGERRFVEILLILALDRPFFFLDEPFTRIDPIYVEECRELILDRSAAAGILVTDHNHIDLKKVSHRRVVMEYGRILPRRR